MAQVDREMDQARHDVPGAWLYVPPAIGDHGRPTCLFDKTGHGGSDAHGGLQRIASQIHRRGAGVVGASFDGGAEAEQAGNRVDDAERHALVGEDAALLDVQLDEGVEIVAYRVLEVLGCETNRAHGFANAHSVRVTQRIELGRVDQAEHATGAPEVGVEAAVLFLAQRNHLQRSPGPAGGGSQNP